MGYKKFKIGNWVYPTTCVWPHNSLNLMIWGPIEQIFDNSLNFTRWSNTPLSAIQPINISADWLQAFEFKQIDSVDWQRGNQVLRKVGDGYYQIGGIDISYVHELQNVYELITNKKLIL